MTTPINGYAGAAAAYRRAAAAVEAAPQPETKAEDRGGFADMVKSAVAGAMDASQHGEKAAMAAISGNADLTDVVTAVAEAEVTLQTVVAIRDKVVAAYQEISRMPV
jgi:flagellar hook-basal body complex protein FliE